MAERFYKGVLDADGWTTTLSERDTRLSRVPDPPAPVPLILEGEGGLAVSARCHDFGKVDVEIWAGDPGLAATGWIVAVDGEIEGGSNGLTIGSALYPALRTEVPPGPSHVRVDAHRDSYRYIASMRLGVRD